MNKIPITVIIPTKNEEVNLTRCLGNLSNFKQVIVIDSESIDQTPEIVKKFNVEYYNFSWNGKFPKKRNWALRNINILNNWVLFLDADEYLTADFIREISKRIKDSKINGYWINYQNHFMGKKLRHGDTMKKLALFMKGKGEYEKIEEDSWSHLDMEVHEHPIIIGKTGKLSQPIIHYDYKGLEHYIARHNAYSTWEAKRYLQLRKTGFSNLTFRQQIKYRLLSSGILPFVYFIGSYFFKLGFLDGKPGYYISRYKAYYFFQIRTKIIELLKNDK